VAAVGGARELQGSGGGGSGIVFMIDRRREFRSLGTRQNKLFSGRQHLLKKQAIKH